MKRLLFLCFSLLFLTQSVAAQSDTLEQAISAYEGGDYAAAIILFTRMRDTEPDNGAHYYNLGNAYLQSGDLGHALVNYRRAQQYLPRDTEVNTMIANIHVQRTNIQENDNDILNNLADSTRSMLTVNELSMIGFGLWILFFIVLFFFLFFSRQRDILRILVVVIGIPLIICLGFLGSHLVVESSRPPAVIVASSTSAMSGPGDEYFSHFQVFAAAEVHIIEERAGWVRIALPDGQQGWVEEHTVEKI